MAEYTVTFATSARKEFEKLDAALIQRIWRKIERLTSNPRPKGCTKLTGTRGLWRVRVGEYRIVYAVDDMRHEVDVITIRHRRDVYR